MKEQILARYEEQKKSLPYGIIDHANLESYRDLMIELSQNQNAAVTIIHDKDPDGITAGNLMIRALKDIGVTNVRHMHLRDVTAVKEKAAVNKCKYSEYIIFQDIPLYSKEEIEHLLDMDHIKKIVIIDHHPFSDLKSNRIILLKSDSVFDCKDPSQYCTAKLTWDLTNLIVDMSDYEWIEAIGIIGDTAFLTFGNELMQIMKKHDVEIEQATSEQIYSTKFGLLTQLVSFGNAFYPDRVSHVFSAMKQSNNLAELEDKLSFCKVVLDDVDYNIKTFFDHALFYDPVYVLELKSNYHIGSQISTAVSMSNPDKIIMVKRLVNDKTVMSFRYQTGKVNVGGAVREAAKKIKSASGGGHRPAAGARCDTVDFEDYLEEIIRQFSNPKFQ